MKCGKCGEEIGDRILEKIHTCPVAERGASWADTPKYPKVLITFDWQGTTYRVVRVEGGNIVTAGTYEVEYEQKDAMGKPAWLRTNSFSTSNALTLALLKAVEE